MRDLLKRGIAVHHSGILPIIKEVRQFEVSVHSAVGVVFHCNQTKDVQMSSISGNVFVLPSISACVLWLHLKPTNSHI